VDKGEKESRKGKKEKVARGGDVRF